MTKGCGMCLPTHLVLTKNQLFSKENRKNKLENTY